MFIISQLFIHNLHVEFSLTKHLLPQILHLHNIIPLLQKSPSLSKNYLSIAIWLTIKVPKKLHYNHFVPSLQLDNVKAILLPRHENLLPSYKALSTDRNSTCPHEGPTNCINFLYHKLRQGETLHSIVSDAKEILLINWTLPA